MDRDENRAIFYWWLCLITSLLALGVNITMVVIGALHTGQTTCQIDIVPIFLLVSGAIMIVFALVQLWAIHCVWDTKYMFESNRDSDFSEGVFTCIYVGLVGYY